MPFDQNNLPEWNATGVEPPQSKKDNGWGATEKPPADWFNWFFNKTYSALKSLFTNAQHKEEKGQPNGYASLDENAKVPASQLPLATTSTPGAMSAPDKAKLDGITPGAEPNQNAFSNVKVGSTTIAADSKTDTLELVAGNAVTITPDAANDRITISVPNATPSTAGAMTGPDKAKLDGIAPGAEVNQNAFSNVKVGTTTISADSKTDTLELVAGQNIVLTPDAANDKVTIDVTGLAPSSHTHPFSDITNKPTTVDGYGITDAVKTSDVVTSPTPNKILKLDANGKLPTSITGNADGNAATASKLQTARTISLTGDATGSTSFDGSSNASIAVTLANSGVTPGTYPKVTVDAKGRVTGGQSLSPSDIPNLDWSKITSGKPTTLSGYGITDAVNKNGDTMTGPLRFNTPLPSGVNTSDTPDKWPNDGITYYTVVGSGQLQGQPTLYGKILHIAHAGTKFQYYFEWKHPQGGASGSVWYRHAGENDTTWGQWHKIWHEGNDGAGSGLDADTVDGKQASDFVWKTEKGAPNGVATLDANGKVPASQLNISTSADAISITDSGGYYTSSEVEGALQEIGQTLNAMRGDLITSVNNVLNM